LSGTSSYNDWLWHIKQLVTQLQNEILHDSNIKHTILLKNRKPPIVRLITDGEFLDFKVKEIRTSDVKRVWIAKVVDVGPDTHFIIHTRKENDWLCVTGRVIINRAEVKISDYHSKPEMYVLDISYLRPFRRYLASLNDQIERNKQQRLSNYIKK